ncbi:hypothetical protein L6452_06361 [Arctium lappa]|uniref:Uncharacterized protein n=1 Tax=Arctium lappa TaxID=4217 RepID=A0ACB9EIP8_ARCLA|nr:hypothetical protein L6452_06361 [Arctium lappa]
MFALVIHDDTEYRKIFAVIVSKWLTAGHKVATLVTRDSESEVTMSTYLDALFAEDDNVIVSDDSDSDGYLSEIYEELAKHKKTLDKLKNKVSLFFEIKHRECSTRRSTRLTLEKYTELGVMERERNEPVNLDEASEPKSSCKS